MGSTFKFELSQEAEILVSGEKGQIIARAEYLDSAPQYLLRYKNGQRVAIESWWSESALLPVLNVADQD